MPYLCGLGAHKDSRPAWQHNSEHGSCLRRGIECGAPLQAAAAVAGLCANVCQHWYSTAVQMLPLCGCCGHARLQRVGTLRCLRAAQAQQSGAGRMQLRGQEPSVGVNAAAGELQALAGARLPEAQVQRAAVAHQDGRLR